MANLSVGIVGLPNVGKSTLFNALLRKQTALAANYPFATVEPNIGIVGVPDLRLEKLAQTVATARKMQTNPPIVPAIVKFVDIAGLVKGANEGEGLGNQFLANIRETSVICHVLRAFTDDNVIRSGSVDPVSDIQIIRTELQLADLSTLEKQKPPKGVGAIHELPPHWSGIQKLLIGIKSGKMASQINLTDEEAQATQELFLLTAKPEIFIFNVDENDAGAIHELPLQTDFVNKTNIRPDQVIVICAKIEAELAELSSVERKEYLQELGLQKSGLEKLIQSAYSTLNLISFLTAGEKEIRAWTIKKGTDAINSAGVIHTDFMKSFIKAKICNYQDFINLGGWQKCADAGKLRIEGRDYVLQDGEVVEFMIGK